MDKVITVAGPGIPLRRSNVDTDQIIPAEFLKRVTKTGYDDALFYAWRADPSFVLNLEPYARGGILVAGPDFGTGSSREHAVWALKDFGITAVISTRFWGYFSFKRRQARPGDRGGARRRCARFVDARGRESWNRNHG